MATAEVERPIWMKATSEEQGAAIVAWRRQLVAKASRQAT
jgi:hypothetical protein